MLFCSTLLKGAGNLKSASPIPFQAGSDGMWGRLPDPPVSLWLSAGSSCYHFARMKASLGGQTPLCHFQKYLKLPASPFFSNNVLQFWLRDVFLKVIWRFFLCLSRPGFCGDQYWLYEEFCAVSPLMPWLLEWKQQITLQRSFLQLLLLLRASPGMRISLLKGGIKIVIHLLYLRNKTAQIRIQELWRLLLLAQAGTKTLVAHSPLRRGFWKPP